MTSASIMEMQKTGFVASANTAKATAANASVQFSEAMEFASAGQQDESAGSVQSSEVKTHAEKSAAQHTGRKEIRETEQIEPKDDVADEQIAEEVDAKEEAVVKEIADELGVSEEEVREAMEVLGLSVMDLLTQGNMAALAAQLTGMQTIDVLTDENLFAQVTELTQNVQNELQSAADSLGMSMEQLQAAIDEQIAMANEMQISQSGEDVVQPEMLAEETPDMVEQVVSSEVAVVETERLNVTDAVQTEETVPDEETLGQKLVAEPEKTETADKQHSGADEEHGAALMQGNQNMQAAGNHFNAVNQVADELFEGRLDVEQTRELINQISDYVRVHHSERISSMEIQLHPVELGTVNLQVVAKDGAVSARLAVQDEAVRAALESQVIQLRESLQAQGLKIDAVEVTVATHEFEQNLDQHGREAEEQAASEKKKGRKILDLNEIGQEDLEDAEISDADRLQIEMMRMGGNRLNFRV
ncbi:MAG: hypothetical protein E7289_08260 [Lachnospiraceae bacterium]|nr:hypothetical protein [Lachnospiraceae bacterium]